MYNSKQNQKMNNFSRDIILLKKSNFKGLRMKLPRLCTSGIQAFRTDLNKFSFNLQFPQEKREEIDLFLQKMLELEEYHPITLSPYHLIGYYPIGY
jgi:hypothetical protein